MELFFYFRNGIERLLNVTGSHVRYLGNGTRQRHWNKH